MPKQRKQQEKTETKTEKVLSYLSNRVSRWIPIIELEAIVVEPIKYIRKLRNQGYPIKTDWGEGSDPKFMLVANAENICKFCKGRGCLSCGGTGVSSKGGEENVQQACPTKESKPDNERRNTIDAGGLSVSISAEQALDFFEGAI